MALSTSSFSKEFMLLLCGQHHNSIFLFSDKDRTYRIAQVHAKGNFITHLRSNTCVYHILSLSLVRLFLLLAAWIHFVYMLLLLLSHFSRVRLCATPEMAAHQAPPSLGFSRQEHWSGLPFPSPMHESEVAQSCPTFSNPMDCSLPGSSIHGIFQARVLEWGVIAFSVCIYNIPLI